MPLANLSELALVFTDPLHRPSIRASLAMMTTLGLTLPRHGTEEAQLTRLAWWDAELQRFMAGTPEHPATQALLEHGLPVLQAAHWQTLIRGQAQRLTTPNPDKETLDALANDMGAGFSAMATLIGATETIPVYQQLGGAIWLVDQLCTAPGHTAQRELMDAAEQRLSAAAAQLVVDPGRVSHRFAIVLASLYERTAQRESRRPGAGPPGPARRLWLAWRAALRAR